MYIAKCNVCRRYFSQIDAQSTKSSLIFVIFCLDNSYWQKFILITFGSFKQCWNIYIHENFFRSYTQNFYHYSKRPNLIKRNVLVSTINKLGNFSPRHNTKGDNSIH